MKTFMTAAIAVLGGMVLGLCGCGSSEPSAGFTAPRAATSTVLVPTITGPIQGGIRGQPWAGTVEQLAPLSPYDFIQEEYFISGTAQARDEHGPLTGAAAAYTTRLLVQRPSQTAEFNGHVVLEWLNASSQS